MLTMLEKELVDRFFDNLNNIIEFFNMITNIHYDSYLPSHLNHLKDDLLKKMESDALMYDILALSKEIIICYFLEPNQTSGGVGLFTEDSLPDDVFASGTLIGVVNAEFKNFEAVYSRLFITIPFAEQEQNIKFQSPPRKTKYPIVNKSVLKKSIKDLEKLGFNKFVNVNEVGHKLFNKYNNVSLVDDVKLVDEKRQKQIDLMIQNRSNNHRHSQLHFNQFNLLLKQREKKIDNNAVFAMHWFDHGGAEKFAIASMKKAHELGWNVYCVIDRRGNKHYEKEASKICKNVFNIAEGLPREYWQRFYINLCNKLEIGLLHIHHAISAYQALPKIRALTNTKTILDTTHIIEHADGGYVRVSGVFSQYLNYHHVISEELIGYLGEEISVPNNKLKLGYLFNQAQELKLEDKKFDDLDEVCEISFVGRLVNQKRPYLFIELVKDILENEGLKDKAFKFNMMGEGPLLDVCDSLIKKYNLERNITTLPASHDINELLEKSHFLIVPSENEGLTLVAYEAALNNCLVISADVGSQNEIVASAALFNRHPKVFIENTIDLLLNSTTDNAYPKQLLREQKNKLDQIINKENWESVLSSIYEESKTV